MNFELGIFFFVCILFSIKIGWYMPVLLHALEFPKGDGGHLEILPALPLF
jgi:hypothetical protein